MTEQSSSLNNPDTDQYTPQELRNRWSQRWYDSLSPLLDDDLSGDRIADLLQQSTSNGNSERALAGDHETRELIELLQNGRDAIREGRTEGRGGGATGDAKDPEDSGRVYISVHNTGILVANTGAPFDFLDEEVEEAVCMVGESSKQGLDYIGSKGVGLKSVLASGEAVEFWTTLNESPSPSPDGAGSESNPFRVRLSRAYTTSAIYAALGIMPDTPEFEEHRQELEAMDESIDSSRLENLLRSKNQSTNAPADLKEKPLERIAKQPLFYLPVKLGPEDRDSALAQRARALITGEGPGTGTIENHQRGAFRTAVFIEYADDAWRELLPELPEELQKEVFARREMKSERPEGNAATMEREPDVAHQLWTQLIGDDDQTGLEPETLVQLEDIDVLVADRVQSDTDFLDTVSTGEADNADIIKRVSWTINPSKRGREPRRFTVGPGVEYQSVTVHRRDKTETGDTSSRSFRFDVFERPDDWDHPPAPDDSGGGPEPRVIIPREKDGETISVLHHYPLNLYYPIENTTQLVLPFCLHGRFRVQTNRKDLSPNERDYNKWVLNASSNLLRDIAQLSARNNQFGPLYPWTLLPPDPEVRSGRGAPEVLREFVDDVYESIRTVECFPQATAGPVCPGDALFHWNPDVVEGFEAYFSLIDSSAVSESIIPDDISLPSRTLVDGFLQFSKQLEPRLNTVLTAETDQSAWTSQIANDWLQVLETLSSIDNRLPCPQETGRALFAGVTQLLVPDEETSDDDITSVLKDHEETLHETPLLPCLHRKTTTEQAEDSSQPDSVVLTEDVQSDDLLLVPIESLNITDERGQRTVLWNLSGTEDGAAHRAPPVNAGFTVYFFDPKTEQRQSVPRVLQNVSRLWGVRDYDDKQNYYRSLVHSFTREPAEQTTIPVEAIAFLADHVSDITAEDLSTDEGGFIPAEYLKKALNDSGGATTQQRRLRRRLAIRDAELELDTDTITPGTAIRNLSTGDSWQRLGRATRDGISEGMEEGDSTSEWDDYNSMFSAVLPAPSAEAWEPVYNALETTTIRDKQQRLVAETLSLVGVSGLAGLNVLWPIDPAHPSEPHWSPREWNLHESNSDWSEPSATLVTLIDTLDAQPAYLDFIAGAGNHPADTIDHSSTSTCKGPLATSDSSGGNLGSWVWLDTVELLGDDPSNTIEFLQRHAEELAASVLRTGWTCTGGQHQRYSWQKPVPTLLNWQLRTLPIWDLTVSDDLQEKWGNAGNKLRWALPESEGNRPTAADLFPQVTDATELTPTLQDAFGIQDIQELPPVAVADRVQQLLEVLTEVPLAEVTDDHVQLNIEDHDRRWQSAYNQLISQLSQHFETVTDENSPVPFVTELNILTHFPVKLRGNWVAADIEMLRSQADVRHFNDRTPKFWEENAAQDTEQNLYILQHPRSGSFTPLRDHFDSKKIEASPPTITDTSEINLTFEFENREAIQTQLRERREFLIAAMERTNEEEIKNTQEKLTTAIEQLAAGNFPDYIERQLEFLDTSSGLYIAEDTGKPGIILNQNALSQDAADDSTSAPMDSFEASHAAVGISLLVERPGKFREFEHTLRHDANALRGEYNDRFPLEIVQSALGTKRVQEFRQRGQILVQLLSALGREPEVPDVGALFSLEGENANDRIERFEAILTGTDPISPTAAEGEPSQIVQHARKLREMLPEWAEFVADAFYGQHAQPTFDWWCEHIASLSAERRRTVIRWLAENRGFFELHQLASPARSRFENLKEVARITAEVEGEQRASLSEWQSHIEQENATVSWTEQVNETADWGIETLGADDPPEWFFYAATEQFNSTLANPLLQKVLGPVAKDETEDVRDLITRYIYENELKKERTRSDARQRQREAFETLSSTASADLDGLDVDAVISADSDWDDGLEVSVGVGGAGGDAGSSTARPQQAEAFTMVQILRHLRNWVGDNPELAAYVLSGFSELKADQEALLSRLPDDQTTLPAGALEFKWHLSTKWPALSSALNMTPEGLIEHLSSLDSAEGAPLVESPLLKLINVTQEQGPGFDCIDPFGPLQVNAQPAGDGATFTAVEVKSVRGDPPYGFRITSNELRRCRAFLAAKNRIENGTGTQYLSTGAEYVIRFVKVPDSDTANWTAGTEFARPDLVLTEERLHQLFSGDPLDFNVKGGYINLTFDC